MRTPLTHAYDNVSYVSSSANIYSAWNSAPIEGKKVCEGAYIKKLEDPVSTGKLVGNWEGTSSMSQNLCDRGTELRKAWLERTAYERTQTFNRITKQVQIKRAGGGSGYGNRPKGALKTNLKNIIK